MAGSKEGARKARETMKAKYGADYYQRIGKKGADTYNAKPEHQRKPRGFAWLQQNDPDKFKEASIKGGKRGRKSIELED